MTSSLSKMSARWLASWHEECTCLCLEGRHRDLVLVPGACHGWLTTPPLTVPQGFKRAVPSWNLLQPEATSYLVKFRVCGANGCWTPWFANEPTTPPQDKPADSRIRWEIDQLISEETLTTFQLSVHLKRESAGQPSPALRTLYLALMRETSLLPLEEESVSGPGTRKDSRSSGSSDTQMDSWSNLLPVPPVQLPFIYQHDLDPEIGDKICSPTSVTMVLQGAGIMVAPLEVARRAYHPASGIYGVWPMAVHAAYQLGMKGWVQFISGWPQALSYLKKGIPIVAAISFAEGELKEPPYPPTEGHLLVLLGMDEQGHPITHDPHVPQERGAYMKWNLEDFSRAWLGHGRVAYVFPSKHK